MHQPLQCGGELRGNADNARERQYPTRFLEDRGLLHTVTTNTVTLFKLLNFVTFINPAPHNASQHPAACPAPHVRGAEVRDKSSLETCAELVPRRLIAHAHLASFLWNQTSVSPSELRKHVV